MDSSSTSSNDDQNSKCPFAKLGGPNPHAKVEQHQQPHNEKKDKDDHDHHHHNNKKEDMNMNQSTNSKKGERCPWPFVFFHDPVTGMKDWQSWAILGLALCWMWGRYQKSLTEF